MKSTIKFVRIVSLVLLLTAFAAAQQKPFPVVSTVDEPTIAGRPVQLDAQGKLLPWPMPDNIGYSYSSHFLTQWTILWDQYNRQRLPYYYCCFDFDRTTFELFPDPHWANSTGYLRAMMEGFMEHLYAYIGDPRALTFLQGPIRIRQSRRQTLHRLESARRRLHRASCSRRRRVRLSPPL